MCYCCLLSSFSALYSMCPCRSKCRAEEVKLYRSMPKLMTFNDKMPEKKCPWHLYNTSALTHLHMLGTSSRAEQGEKQSTE